MAFTIPDLTPDTRPWRVNWFGELVYLNNGRRRTVPTYRVLISPVLSDPIQTQIDADVSDQREAWLPLGTLPMVCIGDIWQNGERLTQPDYQQESFDVQILPASADVVKAGLAIDDQFLLPLNEHPWHRGATQSYCISIQMKDGKRLIIPCMEIIRFYFGSSSKLLHKLFAAPLDECSLFSEKTFDEATGHLHLKLASNISKVSAEDIGRIALCKEAKRSASGIYTSCLNNEGGRQPAYPYTRFPFVGYTTLKASGKWLSFAGKENSTFVVYRLQSCSHAFPFNSLTYEVDALTAHSNKMKQNNANAGAQGNVMAGSGGSEKGTLSNTDPSTKLGGKTRKVFGNAQFPDLLRKRVWLEKIDTTNPSGTFVKHADNTIEQVSFGEAMHDGEGRGTDIVRTGEERGYEPDKFKLPGFVKLAIKMALDRRTNAEFKVPVFARIMIAPGNTEPVFPLPRLVDEDGVIDPVTSCSNAGEEIRQRQACFLRIEYESGDLATFAVAIEAQKISQPPVIEIVRKVDLMELVRALV